MAEYFQCGVSFHSLWFWWPLRVCVIWLRLLGTFVLFPHWAGRSVTRGQVEIGTQQQCASVLPCLCAAEQGPSPRGPLGRREIKLWHQKYGWVMKTLGWMWHRYGRFSQQLSYLLCWVPDLTQNQRGRGAMSKMVQVTTGYSWLT